MAAERKKNEITVGSEEAVEEAVTEHSSVKKKEKKKKKNRENTGEDGEIAAREREKLSEDVEVKKKSKKKRVDSEADDDVKKSKKMNVDSDADGDGKKSKKKKKEVDSEAEDDGKESKKKVKDTKVDSEAEDSVKKSKKKSKEKLVDSESEDDGNKSKKEVKEANVSSEAEDGVKKSKKKHKKINVDSEADGDGKKNEESGGDEIGNSETSKVCEGIEGNQRDAKRKTEKRKRDDSDLGAEESTDKEMERKSKKKKPSVDSEVEVTSLSSTKEDAKKKKQSEDSEVEEENNKNSTKDANKEKKKKKQSEVSEAEETSLSSTKDAKKKSKEKKPSEDSEAAENNMDSTKDTNKEKKKKKKKQSDEEKDLNSTKDAKKKKQVEENNKDSTKDAKKKRKQKQKCSKSDEDVTTPSSSKSTKKVKFSDQVEVFPTEDEETEEEDEEEVGLVRGKRFSEEEDALIKKSVLEYIDNHALGDEGLTKVLACQSYPEVKGCWKEIGTALPWRPYSSVYYRAHTVFEQGSKGVWTEEDLELVKEFQKKHGNEWKTLADAMGKHRKHVKDAWRRIRLDMNKKGHWSREEYQSLFDLVNKDIRMKAFKEKHSKHGMLRDNIPWMAISDELGTRNHAMCCNKWYDQLTSPMVAKGIWANVDDYRLLEELMKLDAACIDDVDWDDLLENRDGEACRKRWNQMVHHIGTPGTKTFAEQVEILSDRYCPELAEDRENFDNRPYDPED